MKIWIAAGLLLLAQNLMAEPEVGKVLEMPAISQADSTIRLEDFRGEVVYLDFWASWCEPCKASFPFMQQLHEDYSDRGLRVIAVNLDRKPAKAQEFLQQRDLDFMIAWDKKSKAASSLELSGMPSSYIIDREGRLQLSHVGFRAADRALIRSKIEEVLTTK